MYKALVTHIKILPHPNADKLALGRFSGYQVIVGKDVQDNELGIFFPVDGALSEKMCAENNLYRPGHGTNINPEKAGLLRANRRIESIRLRGERSDGLWLPLSSLRWTMTNTDHLKAGDTLTEYGAHLICEKYLPPATRHAMQKTQKLGVKTRDIPMFHKHTDTAQLRFELNRIPVGAYLELSEKMHGTSGRTGKVLVPVVLNKFQILWNRYLGNFLGLSFQDHTWEIVTGSRTVVRYVGFKSLRPDKEEPTDFRYQIHKAIGEKLRKGETLYYEIVGYEGYGGASIMPPHALDKTDPVEKELAVQYNTDSMTYTYGTVPGQYLVYVYKITLNDVDGREYELGPALTEQRCTEMGLNYIKVLARTIFSTPDQLLKELVPLTQGHSTFDPSHIREGVVVRVEHPEYVGRLKQKSWHFCHLENLSKSKDLVDPEEAS